MHVGVLICLGSHEHACAAVAYVIRVICVNTCARMCAL